MTEALALFLPIAIIFFFILILWLIPVRLWIER